MTNDKYRVSAYTNPRPANLNQFHATHATTSSTSTIEYHLRNRALPFAICMPYAANNISIGNIGIWNRPDCAKFDSTNIPKYPTVYANMNTCRRHSLLTSIINITMMTKYENIFLI